MRGSVGICKWGAGPRRSFGQRLHRVDLDDGNRLPGDKAAEFFAPLQDAGTRGLHHGPEKVHADMPPWALAPVPDAGDATVNEDDRGRIATSVEDVVVMTRVNEPQTIPVAHEIRIQDWKERHAPVHLISQPARRRLVVMHEVSVAEAGDADRQDRGAKSCEARTETPPIKAAPPREILLRGRTVVTDVEFGQSTDGFLFVPPCEIDSGQRLPEHAVGGRCVTTTPGGPPSDDPALVTHELHHGGERAVDSQLRAQRSGCHRTSNQSCLDLLRQPGVSLLREPVGLKVAASAAHPDPLRRGEHEREKVGRLNEQRPPHPADPRESWVVIQQAVERGLLKLSYTGPHLEI